MSDRPECSYPTCDDLFDVSVLFEDGATADYCEYHGEYALDEYAGIDDYAAIPEDVWDA